MSGKVYTLKPDIAYKKGVSEKTSQETSLKDKIIEGLENFLLILLVILFLVLSVGIAYKSLVYIKIRSERNTLLLEKKGLQEQLKNLTSREVLLEKAKKLGLRLPTERDYIYLK